MSYSCNLLKKKPLNGHKVSHSNKKTKRLFDVNTQKKTFSLNINGKITKITKKISARGIKQLDKLLHKPEAALELLKSL